MQNFLTDINYHYYIIYPPVFLQDYHIWWERRPRNRSISLQYTCLLAIVCACALQHVEPASEPIFESEFGDSLDVVSDQLHAAMRELASVIPVGHYHILNVQRLLHSCYWYKAEAKFLEAWHVLSAAILEGRELGYHKAPAPGTVSDFDLEMQRRLWCILDTWDWWVFSLFYSFLYMDICMSHDAACLSHYASHLAPGITDIFAGKFHPVFRGPKS